MTTHQTPLPNSAVTIYTPRSAFAQPGKLVLEMLRDLWSGRGLAWRIFVRDTAALYRQSVFGYLWALVPPLVTSTTFIFLSSQNIVRVAETPVPYAAYVMIGTLLWQGFVDAFNSPIRAVGANRGMLLKVKFPREALILAGLLDVVFNSAIRVLLLVPVFWHFKMPLGPSILFFPIGLATLLLLGLSLGLLLTPAALLYNDISRASSILTGFWLFLTPVVYPPPQAGLAAILSEFNPVAPALVTTRDWLTSQQPQHLQSFFVIAGLSLLLLFVGALIYRVALPHLVERMGG